MSSERVEFEKRVKELTTTVVDWTRSHEWIPKFYSKKMRDRENNLYEVPALQLQKGPMRLLLDPVGYDVQNIDAIIDLYLVPNYDDMASLYFKDGSWKINYAFPPEPFEAHSIIETQEFPFDEDMINKVLDSIAEHAAPSF